MKVSLLTLLCAGAASSFAVCDPCRPTAVSAAGGAAFAAAVAPLPDPAIEPKTVTLRIEGMTCGGCAIAARKALEWLDGVKKAEVRYEEQRAGVTYDPEKVTVEQMIAAVKKLGYAAAVVEG